jgi:serine O-acetyltransferase
MSFLRRIREDIDTVRRNDPAARNALEILLCYPGLHAVWLHGVANWFYRRRFFTVARIVSHVSRWFTGVEIHPGATLGRGIFIDHGMGIVVGETAEIGDNCLLYKGVVLGGTTLSRGKRHPTLGRNVVVGSNACLLGDITVGDHVRVGSNSVVIRDVPPGSTVVGVPARVVERKEVRDMVDFEHGNLPDPMDDILKIMLRLEHELEKRVERLEKEHDIKAPRIIVYDEPSVEEMLDAERGGTEDDVDGEVQPGAD